MEQLQNRKEYIPDDLDEIPDEFSEQIDEENSSWGDNEINEFYQRDSISEHNLKYLGETQTRESNNLNQHQIDGDSGRKDSSVQSEIVSERI